MPAPTKGPRLGGSPAHQRSILSNLATSLFEHGAITTTEAKARRLRPFAEKLITKAKRGDLHNRRLVLRVIRDKSVVHVLFTEIGPRYDGRNGGYTRITKIGPRKGDNAPMAVIELVTEELTTTPRTTKRAAGKRAPAKAADAAAPGTRLADAPVDPTIAAGVDPSETDGLEAAESEADESDAQESEADESDAQESEADESAAEPSTTEQAGSEQTVADDTEGAPKD